MTAPLQRNRTRDQVAEKSFLARRRRPSGDLAALPRPLYTSGRVYVALSAIMIACWVAVLAVPPVADLADATDRAVLRLLEVLRTDPLVAVATSLQGLAGSWAWRVLRWTTIVAGLAFGRLRHVIVLLGLVLVASQLTTLAVGDVDRPADAVEVVEAPAAFAQPSRPIVELSLAVTGVLYVMVPRGRARNRGKVATALVIGPFVLSGLFLGLLRPSDALAGIVLGVAVPILAFRYLVPNGIFPITYGKQGRRTLTAEQVDGIRNAAARQFGWEVTEVRALRPPGSSGSTPLILQLEEGVGGAPPAVFAKLYSLTHLRADRWYKVGRAIRYGRLEDESPFATVRQLVEHEDYVLRLARAEGIPVPQSHGLMELTPGREYLLVTELLPFASQLGDEPVSESTIDQGIEAVERMWAAGMAHRDVKPANIAMSGGRLFLVDCSFGEVVPTHWRQSVDLANMLLSLGLYADPEVVYRRALLRFDADEIGEAFATVRSITMPAQLRRLLRERSPDLADRFRSLAPIHRPIAIQRWSAARVGLTAAAAGAATGGATLLVYNLRTVGL